MSPLRLLPRVIYQAVDWQALSRPGEGAELSVAPYREALKAADEALERAFRAGEDAAVLVHGRATIMDHLLKAAWEALELGTSCPLALIAVGGYGRGELHPRSDIDLMLLLGSEPGPKAEQLIERFVTFLWDIGVKVGHSVRTLAECVAEARRDVSVATNLMEARLLSGPVELYCRLRESTGPDHIWPSAEFFRAKLEEQQARYRKFGDTAYKLEPNVKEGPGGLRDIQMVGWVAKRHLHVTRLCELVDHGFLSEEEYRTLVDGQNFLWRVRFALHTLSRRTEDRLLFDHQVAVAALFGYRDQDHNLAVEQFMQRYYRTVMELERLNEMLLQLYQEAILYAHEQARPQPINRRFQAHKGFLEVTHDAVFRRHPSALLELFLILQQHPELKGVRAATIRLVRKHRHLIDEAFRSDLRNRSLFMEILRQPAGITHELRRMNRYGILAAYWPAFGRIVGRMQYDLFHVYTVDEHILLVLRNLRRMAVERHAQELPFCSRLIRNIPKLETLYLAALFHDIAKGRRGDHSRLGAEEAERFCRLHGLSDYDSRLVAWLVRHHLLMSMTAQRKDISDPEVINAFARTVGSQQRLNHLYLLTIADIRGTNPELWTSWKHSLLLELYHASTRALRRGLHNPLLEEEIIAEVKRNALNILAQKGQERAACDRLWQIFNGDYFLRHTADEVSAHTQAILAADPEPEPLVVIRQRSSRGGTEIFVYAPARNYIFARITAVLAGLGLNIQDARIITAANDYTLDTFMVLDEDGRAVQDDYRVAEIRATVARVLEHPDAPLSGVSRRLSRRKRHFDVPTEIHFDNAGKRGTTQMELITCDHPGLLSQVGQAFMDSGVLVHNARIATIGARAEDIFYITDLGHRPITDPGRLARVRDTLLERLEDLPDREASLPRQ
jgi:[protein-PII] uridylyltransferase